MNNKLFGGCSCFAPIFLSHLTKDFVVISFLTVYNKYQSQTNFFIMNAKT